MVNTLCTWCSAMWRHFVVASHDDVIKWEHFPRYWPFVRGIHRSPVKSPQRPVTRSFDVFFNLRLNNQLSKQSCGGWLETPSCSLWRQYYNDRTICFPIAFLKSRMIRLDCLMTLETTDVFATWLKYQNSAICQKVSNLCFSTAYWVFSTEIVSIWGKHCT